MTNYRSLIESFKNSKVLVIGDVMIDAYLSGTVSRMSPEAPVPVVSISEEVYRLGGAANVALNLMSLGAVPFICSVIGETKSERFLNLLRKNNFSEEGIITSETRKTTQKTRVLDAGKQLLRVDEEDVHDLNEKEESDLVDQIFSIMENHKIDVVIFQDYNKGVITDKVIEDVVKRCNAEKIPTAVDPKLKRFLSFKNVTLFKPNLKELKEGLRLEVDGSEAGEVEKAMNVLHAKLDNDVSFVTLSEYGVAIKGESKFEHFPAHKRNIADVSGAGDTVISVAALCLAKNTSNESLAQLANLAGGLVCEKVGVVPILQDELITSAESQL